MEKFFSDVDIPKIKKDLTKKIYTILRKVCKVTNLQVTMDQQKSFMKRFGTN